MSTESSPPSVNSTIQPLIEALAGHAALPPWSARRALEAIGPDAVPSLEEVLLHGPPDARWEAAKALAALADPASASALVAALEDEDGGVRWLAAEALRDIGRPAIPPLLTALVGRSGSPWLREGAHHVLRSLATDELAPILSPLVQSMHGVAPEISVMGAADHALAQIEMLPDVTLAASPATWHATRGPALQPAHGAWRNLALRL